MPGGARSVQKRNETKGQKKVCARGPQFGRSVRLRWKVPSQEKEILKAKLGEHTLHVTEI